MLSEILATLKKHKGEERNNIDEKASLLDREFDIIFGNEFGIKFGIKFGDNDKRLLLLMNSNPTFSSQMIADRLDITKRVVEKNIKKIRESGVIERVGSNKNGYWKINRPKQNTVIKPYMHRENTGLHISPPKWHRSLIS